MVKALPKIGWHNPMLRTTRDWYVPMIALVIAVCAFLAASTLLMIALRSSG